MGIKNNKQFTHKSKQHNFRYEIINNPWRGPLTKARFALTDVDISPLSPEAFCIYLKDKYFDIYSSISYIRFYQYNNSQITKYPGIDEYRIAVCFIKPHPLLRDKLYQQRAIITKDTGWYPLVMGNIAKLNLPKYKFTQHEESVDSLLSKLHIGQIISLSNATTGNDGSSFYLNGSSGTILLDTGFGKKSISVDGVMAAFLSHFHADHSGGISFLIGRNIPIFMSESTFRFLHDKTDNYDIRNNLRKQTVIIERINHEIPSNSNIKFFQVFHTPGSYGLMIKDHRNNCFWYPGDICLRNGFLNITNQTFNLISLERGKQNWILIDSTMATKNVISISSEDSPDQVLAQMIQDSLKRNIIICTDSMETLMYAFIYVFVKTRSIGESSSIRLFANSELLNIAQSLLGPMIRKNPNQIDPFIKSVIGMNLTNFIESHRVYPLDSLKFLSKEEKTIIFLTPKDINSPMINHRILGSSVILAGKLATDSNRVPKEISQNNPRTILRVSSPDWIFHTSEEDLVRFIKKLTKYNSNVILFHNWESYLENFIERNSLNNKRVSIIKSDEFPLDTE